MSVAEQLERPRGAGVERGRLGSGPRTADANSPRCRYVSPRIRRAIIESGLSVSAPLKASMASSVCPGANGFIAGSQQAAVFPLLARVEPDKCQRARQGHHADGRHDRPIHETMVAGLLGTGWAPGNLSVAS